MSTTAAARAPQADAARRDDALGAANRTRLARAQLKRELRARRLTPADIAAHHPQLLRDMSLFALLGQLPGVGQRLEQLNQRAIAAHVNLARTLADASTATLRWLVTELDDAEPAGLDVDVTVPLERTEHDWRTLALTLDRLIREHERSVRDESLPAERWACVDEQMHHARAATMRRRP